MAYADQQMSGNKIIAIIVVALIHVALGYVLITGLAYSAAKKLVERVTTVDIEEPPPPEEEPPPPPPDEVRPPPPVAPPPPINISVAPPPIQTVTTPPPPAPVIARPAPAAPPPPPPAPSQARGAQPDGQARWQQRIMDNYPRRAVNDEIEGRVGVRVQISADGRVSSCSVSSSSGSSILDEAACADLTRFGRFKPALNDDGDPTTGSWATTIVYQLGR
ncbi:TonB family protein [Croceibacterium sp. LX-88]|jgi:protein TonB|uniref:Protein TonB n=1 Tax=Croceibacterium selenioxidans TaxID=2838833 RepID=A0ABS5W5X6_9SPHN|nr:TonB family protein [Croceibacterium selenioxidans]MBT2135152.1 TonB family protein [Croceibacterium selenioxidans]